MELTLSVSPGPVLSVETLVAFVKKANSKGKDASVMLASMISSEVASTSRRIRPTATPKKKARAAA